MIARIERAARERLSPEEYVNAVPGEKEREPVNSDEENSSSEITEADASEDSYGLDELFTTVLQHNDVTRS